MQNNNEEQISENSEFEIHIDQVISFVNSKNLTDDEKEEQLQSFIDKFIDFLEENGYQGGGSFQVL